MVECTAYALKLRSLPVIRKDTDTGKRIFMGQMAREYGTSYDNEWLYIDAPSGRGWASKSYLTIRSHIPLVPVEDDLATPNWPRIPHGREGIERLFGDPGNPMCTAGRVKFDEGFALKLGWKLETVVRGFACHKLIEDVLTDVFHQIAQKDLWSLLHTFDGCYNYRDVKGVTEISTHAWGISTDLDASLNPLSAIPKMDQRIVRIFEDHGFVWGGNWARPDGMHFQYATGY